MLMQVTCWIAKQHRAILIVEENNIQNVEWPTNHFVPIRITKKLISIILFHENLHYTTIWRSDC